MGKQTQSNPICGEQSRTILSAFGGFKRWAFGLSEGGHVELGGQNKGRRKKEDRRWTTDELFFLARGGFVFFDRFWFFAFRLGFFLRGVLSDSRFLAFFCFFVALASIIGLIEAGPLEDYPCSGADKPFQPFFCRSSGTSAAVWLLSSGTAQIRSRNFHIDNYK